MSSDVAEKKVVFVVGTGHSGSTLVGLILSSHSQAFGLGEVINIPVAFKQPSGYPRICLLCDGPCEFWNDRVSSKWLRRWYTPGGRMRQLRSLAMQALRSPYRNYFAASGCEILVDYSKSLRYARFHALALRAHRFAQPVLVWNIRDGRAVLNSYLRKYPETDVDKWTDVWVTSIEKTERYFDNYSGQKAIVHYDELSNKPQSTVRTLCETLGLKFEMDMLSYWTKDHHIAFGNAGTRSLISKYRSSIGADSPTEDASHEADFYDDIGLAIRPDIRWRSELPVEAAERFERRAGRVNMRITAL